jgi:Uncharacterized protein conserved in bacteria
MTRQDVIDFCLTFSGAYEDYPFDKVKNDKACTALRHRQNKKTFTFIMRHGEDYYVNLKCEPTEADFLRSVYKSVIPGYHMNKNHWNTVVLGGDVPDEELRQMIASSYDLIKPKIKQRNKKKTGKAD